MEYMHVSDCNSLLVRIVGHKEFGVNGIHHWPYLTREARFIIEIHPNCKTTDELIEILSSLICSEPDFIGDYYHIYESDLYEGDLSFFSDWEFNPDNLKIKNWSYGVIVCSALIHLMQEDLNSYLRKYAQDKFASVHVAYFAALNWLYILQFFVNHKVGPILSPLLIELDLFERPEYIARVLFPLIYFINLSPNYFAVFNCGSRGEHFIQKGLVNFLTLFKVSRSEAQEIAEQTVKSRSVIELVSFLKRYKLTLESKINT